jgi:hypothetical protein
MDSISGSLGIAVWSQDPGLMPKLDEAYRKDLHPWISTDGTYNPDAYTAWRSYCLELAVIFSERFPTWESAPRYFRDLSECYTGYLNPVITTSYIEDLTLMWSKVHPALLEAKQTHSFYCSAVDMSSTDYSLVRTVHRLWPGLQPHSTTLRRHDCPRVSRSRAVSL